DTPPSILGMPLKYVSLITLAVQNAALTIIMHHSRVSTPPSRAYSAASAVLLNELLKGFISLAIAASRIEIPHLQPARKASTYLLNGTAPFPPVTSYYNIDMWLFRFRRVGREVFSDDCWKLAIPAILYVVQNNLQYVAAANLDVATFTVTYQMKILTTAAFSVMLLRKKLGSTKWLALFFLAVGVGIVQLQAGSGSAGRSSHHPSAAIMSINGTISLSDHEPGLLSTDPTGHAMQPLKGFLAVTAACFTSGLAGVYFEMVLKGSKADLWIRNVQLSLFSLLPALVPIMFSSHPADSAGWFWDLFRNFGVWAWATVAVQVFGGLVTAIVIKYSDNILKGFATSLSIIISFLASVALFNFRITPAFVFGSTIVLLATFMYNKPASKSTAPSSISDGRLAFPGSPLGPNAPILGQFSGKRRFSTSKNIPRSIASMLGMNNNTRPDMHTPLSETHPDTQYRSYQQGYYSNSPTP
ncbi:nucleotide-sugar transporter-domain-containing protein, partial [Hysterangium stoloniferum]